MRRFLLALLFAGLLVGLMSAGGAAKVKPPSEGGLVASPASVVFETIWLDWFDFQTVKITNGTSHEVYFRSPGASLPSPFSHRMNSCQLVAPGDDCFITYRVTGGAIGTFKTTVVEPFYWVDSLGAEHAVNAKLKLTATVAPGQPPTAESQSVGTDIETAKTITLTGGDPNGDALTFSIAVQPTNGSLSAIGEPSCSGTPATCTATVTYTPNDDFVGSDEFMFETSDGVFDSWTVGTVSITVGAPVNQQPSADANEWQYWDTSPHEVTLSGDDPDGDELDFYIVEGPSWGELGTVGAPSCTGDIPNHCTAKVTFTAPATDGTSTSFTYQTSDGELISDIATVTVIPS